MAENLVLITTDLSEPSVLAVQQGIQHAATTGAKVELLFICPEFHLPAPLHRQLTDPASLQKIQETYEKDEQERLTKFLEAHNVRLSEVSTKVIFSSERASDVIVRYAKEQDARLIVMASQGKGALGRLILGSNTQRVALHAPCPILIVPPPHKPPTH